MKSWFARTAVFAVAFTFLAVWGVADAADNPDIETIMKKVNGGKGFQKKQLPDALKASPIDWTSVQKITKEYSELCSYLGKNEPPKGDKQSWDKLTKEYAANAKKLDDAAEKKDKDAVVKTQQVLGASCNACHKQHKG
jgi:cytochrome c556